MSDTTAGERAVAAPRTARGGSTSWVTPSGLAPRLGRAYFALQALAGALWWVLVFTAPAVRIATLGGLAPVLVALLDVPLFVVASALAACGSRWAMRIAVVWTLLVAAAVAAYATLTGLAGWGALLMVAAAIGGFGAALLMAFRRIPAETVLRGVLGFGTARPAPPSAQLRRTLLQLGVFWILFLAVLPALIRFFELRWGIGIPSPVPAQTSPGPGPAPEAAAGPGLADFGVPVLGAPVFGGIALGTAEAGIFVLVLASALGLWAAFSMSMRGAGTPLPSASANLLVVVGPYRLVRNPMAIAGIAQAVGVGLVLGSWPVGLYALCGAIYWDRLVRPYEEADLAERFGAAYEEYRARVDCWVPRLR